MVHFVESCKNSNDIRTWVCVFLAQNTRQENSQGLRNEVRGYAPDTDHEFLHLVHRNPPARPQLLPREWHGQRNAEFGSSYCISCLSLLFFFSGTLSESWLTCRPIVSSGLKLSRIAWSWFRSGGSKKSSLQKPSEGSASSVAYKEYVSNIT